MVQMFQKGPSASGKLAEALGASLGQGLGEFTGNYFANKAIDRVLDDPQYKDKPLSERQGALQRALGPFGERGQKQIQQRMQIEQSEIQEKKQNSLAKAFEKLQKGESLQESDLKNLDPNTQMKLSEVETQRKEQTKKLKQKDFSKKYLIKNGMPEDEAEYWSNSSTGSQTELNKLLLDYKKRDISPSESVPAREPAINVPGLEEPETKYEFPDISESEGRTPSEKVKQQDSREKFNLPVYESTMKTLNGLDDEYKDIQRLQQLNEGDRLPQGVQKWNIDWNTGDARVPALLTPESQLYVKTMANMLGKAKEFFPGRVTNFDLESFKKRFPTLANSKEGRTLIAKQMELANRIAYLKEDSMKNAIEHYGAGSNPVSIRKYANENYQRMKGELEGRLKSLDGLLENQYQKQEKEINKQENKKDIPTPSSGHIIMEYQGQIGEVPENEVEKALKNGAKRL